MKSITQYMFYLQVNCETQESIDLNKKLQAALINVYLTSCHEVSMKEYKKRTQLLAD